jgi:D-aminoacyl-tRNA deacylase
MIALLQRVTQAEVVVEGASIARIGAGLLCFIGVERGDTEREAERLLERVLAYRVFADSAGRMNHCLTETGGSLLLVPQFTLAADTRKGARPSFTPAAAPERGRELFAHCCAAAQRHHAKVACGQFGAEMQVSLTNDGPVTFWLQVAPTGA